MRLCLKTLLIVILFATLVQPALAQYSKSGNEIMVRIMVRYDGPETSPFIRNDIKGMAIKEAVAAKVRGAIENVGGTVGYSYRHVNVVSGTIPISGLEALGKNPAVAQIAKDFTVRVSNFSPLTATEEEKRAWAKLKAEEIKAKVAQRLTNKAVTQKNLMEKFSGSTTHQKGSKELDILNHPIRIDGTITSMNVEDLTTQGVFSDNYAFYNMGVTNAAALWNQTERGKGIIIASLDSGVYSGHPLLTGSVIGGENAPGMTEFEESIDNNGDGQPDGISYGPTAIQNDPHGTGTSCMAVCHGTMVFPSNDRFLKAVQANSPGSVIDNGNGTKSIPLIGSAPGASIFAMKITAYNGSSTISIILAGMDRVIDLKVKFLEGRPGGVNFEVANMSIGTSELFPGFGVLDKQADNMVAAGIQTVISAGNEGPAPYSISSPGSSLTAITVAAGAEHRHNANSFEGAFPELPVGGGADMVLSHRTQKASFSSTGPLPAGYGKPDVIAEGNACLTAWIFDNDGDGVNDTPGSAIVSGTSFSAPTTAGGVALLIGFAKNNGLSLANQAVKAALLLGARRLPGLRNIEQGFGYVDIQGAANYWMANPKLNAGKLNKRKIKFKGSPYLYLQNAAPGVDVAIGNSRKLLPGEQDDFLLPQETSSTDQAYYMYLYIYGSNPQREKPFPGSVRSFFDTVPSDGSRSSFFNNTETYYAEGINTGINAGGANGCYDISSLNQVDTLVFAGSLTFGGLLWLPDFFPALTMSSIAGFVDPASSVPVTNEPSLYAQMNPHENMGSGGYADFDKLSFAGDVTNDGVNPVQSAFIWIKVRRSAVGLTTGTPVITDTIGNNQVKQYTLNLPPAVAGYSFLTAFTYGWNAFKFGPPTAAVIGTKRKTADVDMFVTTPDGDLLNETAFPGIFQGASINDLEAIHDVLCLLSGICPSGGKFNITIVGFDLKGVPNNRTNFGVTIWDGFEPIIP